MNGLERYANQPHEIALETLAQCNARCTFCPYPTLERIGERMPDELIERLIDEMATFRHPFYFSPFKVNEPFLDKRLIPICQTFNRKVPHGILRLFTNGSALTDDNVTAVAGLQRVIHLWVSLNSHDPDEYERLMGLKFSLTTKRLDALHARDFPFPVVVSRVGEDPAFREYVRERWPKFQPAQIKRDGWLGYTEPQNSDVPQAPCTRWWELSIMATGKVALCCMDGTGEYAIGDVTRQTLLQVYNSPAYRARRVGLMARGDISPCNRCTY